MTRSLIQGESVNLADTFAFTGTVSGLPSGGSAFCVRSDASAWATIADGAILIFDDDSSGDSFDTGSNFSTSTYKYTAPATGVYLFWYSIYTHYNDTSNAFSFLKNSAKVDFQRSSARLLSADYGTDEHVQTATIVIPLSSADTMAVCGALASDYYRGHSQWGGCRLA